LVAKRAAKVQNIAGASDDAVQPLIRVLAAGAGIDAEHELAVAANRLLDLEREYPRNAKTYAPSPETRAAVAQLRDALRATGAPFDAAITQRERVESPESDARDGAALHSLVDLLVDWVAAKWKAGAFEGW